MTIDEEGVRELVAAALSLRLGESIAPKDVDVYLDKAEGEIKADVTLPPLPAKKLGAVTR